VKRKSKYVFKKRFLFFLSIIVYVVICFGQQFYRIAAINSEIDSYLNTKKQLMEEQENLMEEIKLLENRSYIERIAREDLGLIKPGETLLVPGKPGDLPQVKSVQSVSDNIH